MNEKYDIQSLGLEISKILRKYQLPTNDFHLEFHLKSDSFNRISISWQLYSKENELNPVFPRIDFDLVDEELFKLLTKFGYLISNYGLIIGMPENNFDTYIENYPEELSSVDVVQKIGNNNGIDYYYVIQKIDAIT
jgi:hypothetical protein